MQLLDEFVFFIGHTQNYVDPREAADRISLLYRNQRNGIDHNNLWTLEVLLLLAIARLLKGTFGSAEDREIYPGEDLFQFAYEHLPTLSQLLSGGKVAIEVLALVAVYLQNINRKEEAYVYVSTIGIRAVVRQNAKALSVDQHSYETCNISWLPSNLFVDRHALLGSFPRQ